MNKQKGSGTDQTELVSLEGYSLGDLRTDASESLAEMVRHVVRQVAGHRANLGSSGPPGRVD